MQVNQCAYIDKGHASPPHIDVLDRDGLSRASPRGKQLILGCQGHTWRTMARLPRRLAIVGVGLPEALLLQIAKATSLLGRGSAAMSKKLEKLNKRGLATSGEERRGRGALADRGGPIVLRQRHERALPPTAGPGSATVWL